MLSSLGLKNGQKNLVKKGLKPWLLLGQHLHPLRESGVCTYFV